MTGETQVAAIERALENELAEVRCRRGEGGASSDLPNRIAADRRLHDE